MIYLREWNAGWKGRDITVGIMRDFSVTLPKQRGLILAGAASRC